MANTESELGIFIFSFRVSTTFCCLCPWARRFSSLEFGNQATKVMVHAMDLGPSSVTMRWAFLRVNLSAMSISPEAGEYCKQLFEEAGSLLNCVMQRTRVSRELRAPKMSLLEMLSAQSPYDAGLAVS